MSYYSQCGQDKLVHEIFKDLKYGYFVDVGAADGVQISNTYFLESEWEWDGICIEPHTSNFEKLRVNRQCVVDNSFVLRDGEEVDYIEFVEGDNKLFSGVDPSPTYRHKENVVRKVPTTSLWTLLEKHHAPTVIHYMSVDVEGLEYDILKDYFEKEYSPTKPGFYLRYVLTLSVEHNFQEPARTNLRELMAKNNMVLLKSMDQDDFYIHQVMDILA